MDGWRAIAIALVLASHAALSSPHEIHFLKVGGQGVSIFFVLSGFLITGRLLQEAERSGSISLKSFYIRRAYRILPVACVFLSLIALLGPACHVIPVSAQELRASIFFFRNYSPSPDIDLATGQGWFTGHFWSLSIEEQYYLIWPGILISFGFRRARWVAAIGAAGCAIWRWLDFTRGYTAHLFARDFSFFYRTDVRLDALLVGSLFAIVLADDGMRQMFQRVLRPPVAVGLGLLYGALVFRFKEYPALTESLIVAMLIAFTVLSPATFVGRLLESAPMRFIGRLSYSLYIWNQLFLTTYTLHKPFGLLNSLPFNLIALFLASALSYYYLEQPLMRAGKRRTASRELVYAA